MHRAVMLYTNTVDEKVHIEIDEFDMNFLISRIITALNAADIPPGCMIMLYSTIPNEDPRLKIRFLEATVGALIAFVESGGLRPN